VLKTLQDKCRWKCVIQLRQSKSRWKRIDKMRQAKRKSTKICAENAPRQMWVKMRNKNVPKSRWKHFDKMRPGKSRWKFVVENVPAPLRRWFSLDEVVISQSSRIRGVADMYWKKSNPPNFFKSYLHGKWFLGRTAPSNVVRHLPTHNRNNPYWCHTVSEGVDRFWKLRSLWPTCDCTYICIWMLHILVIGKNFNPKTPIKILEQDPVRLHWSSNFFGEKYLVKNWPISTLDMVGNLLQMNNF
jgi:hypothetical protein